jgi:hypothetical protein
VIRGRERIRWVSERNPYVNSWGERKRIEGEGEEEKIEMKYGDDSIDDMTIVSFVTL